MSVAEAVRMRPLPRTQLGLSLSSPCVAVLCRRHRRCDRFLPLKFRTRWSR